MLIETRNNADRFIYNVEKSLGELGSRISSSDKSGIEKLIGDLETAMQGEDTSRIRSLTEELQQTVAAE